MTDRTIACLYFAWVREAVGVGEETVAVGPEVRIVADLLNQLEASDPATGALSTIATVCVLRSISRSCGSTLPWRKHANWRYSPR